jgi:peptidoglycan/xylan/chitin deacetylase (PgdA/CDA1 family)
MLVTAAVAAVVLVVDDGTTARSGAVDEPTTSAPSAAPATTATAAAVPPVDPTSPPLPHRDGMGVIQTTGAPGMTVALTFDDGPSLEYTPRVLDILDRHGIKATFCVVGTSAKAYPGLVKKIADGGHALCDHTVTHDLDLPDRTEKRIHAEISRTAEYIRAAVPHATVSFYRAPGGNFSADVIAVAASYGQQPLGWSVDTRDWAKPGTDAILTAVLDHVGPGSVVLLHDGGGDRSGTVEALEAIITALKAAGYAFVIPTI